MMPELVDILIVGGGPAGTAAAFRAKELGLTAVVIDYDDLMKRIRDYAKDKFILPDFGGGDKMQFPKGGELISKLTFGPIDKDDMCAQWKELYERYQVPVHIGVELTGLEALEDGTCRVQAWNHGTKSDQNFLAKHVVIAFGRGVPRRFDIPGSVDGIAFRLSDDADARQFLVANLGSDRMVSRRELEKLAVYAGVKTSVSLADAIACVGDNGALSLDEVVYAMAGGDGSALDIHLERAYGSGLAPVAILRAAQRHFQKLHMAADAVAGGGSPEQAIKSVRPPIIFLFADRFKRQLSIWSLGRIRAAIAMLLDAETECKSTAMPAQAVCGRALVRLCQAARKSVR